MSHRQFRDSRSVDWDVWEVMPTIAEKPILDRRSSLRADALVSRTEEWLLPSAGMSNGWLLFESSAEKRRLVPIPDGWSHISDAELDRLCQRAIPAPRTPAKSVEPPPA